MKVNMTPNPLDVVTIHASQGDTEARQWEFELHNNGEKIDSSEVTDQIVFKAYKGGTEQILPENTSTPTTSPFKGDIKYPQGLLTDQEFTYRQSPTEEDGLAKVTDIKGNTLVWNQLITDPNFTDVSKWRLNGNYTSAIANNELTLTVVSTDTNAFIESDNLPIIPNGHKFFFRMMVNPSVGTQLRVGYAGVVTGNPVISSSANTWTEYKAIVTSTTSTTRNTLFYFNTQGSLSGVGATIKFKQATLIDLTQMGLDSLTVEEFTSLFPLSYYYYNQGSLLSFMGNGIKKVGFNQWDEEWELGSISNVGVNMESTTEIRSKNYIRVQPNKEYYLHASVASTFNYRFYDADKRFISAGYIGRNNTLLIPNSVAYMRFYMGSAYGTNYNHDICININDPSKNGTYEPYTSSTLFLPISTYFPNGMKSAGNVYDELTPRKAITRIGAVDLGSLTWNKTSGTTSEYDFFETSSVTPIPAPGGTLNVLCPLYKTVNSMTSSSGENKAVRITGLSTIRIRDLSYTDATAFKTAMNGVYLYHELATPTETSFTTASLVTENAEIPLSNEDGILIGKCTEQLSENPGFIDAKIKLSDSDGECYSNKIQLHVERSPQ